MRRLCRFQGLLLLQVHAEENELVVDAVLEEASLPLSLLDRKIERWIMEQK